MTIHSVAVTTPTPAATAATAAIARRMRRCAHVRRRIAVAAGVAATSAGIRLTRRIARPPVRRAAGILITRKAALRGLRERTTRHRAGALALHHRRIVAIGERTLSARRGAILTTGVRRAALLGCAAEVSPIRVLHVAAVERLRRVVTARSRIVRSRRQRRTGAAETTGRVEVSSTLAIGTERTALRTVETVRAARGVVAAFAVAVREIVAGEIARIETAMREMIAASVVAMVSVVTVTVVAPGAVEMVTTVPGVAVVPVVPSMMPAAVPAPAETDAYRRPTPSSPIHPNPRRNPASSSQATG